MSVRQPQVACWFDFASTYSYLAAMRVEARCAATGVGLRWRPFLLGPLFSAQLGIKDSPFNVQPVRGRYMWRDVERLASKFGLAWKRPSVFPRASVLAARVACVGDGQPWQGDVIRALFEANFAHDQDIASPEVVGGVLRQLRLDAAALLTAAGEPPAKAALRASTDEAAALGMFGAPTFVTGEELFFGQDRLEDALAWAIDHS